MSKKWVLALPLIAIAVGVIWCLTLLLVIGILPLVGVVSDLLPKQNQCLSSLPPAGFSKASLVGTWQGGYAGYPGRSDTLILREDGAYKQIIHTDVPLADYESDWQAWWLEYHASGVPYLHLEGMRFCAINPSFSCDRPTGKMFWHDFCEDKNIAMDNEGILIVLRGTLAFPMGSENSWFYVRKQP